MPLAPRRLANQFTAAVADGLVSDSEAAGLIRTAAAQKLTPAETRELKRELAARGDAFEPAARKRMEHFVGAGARPYQTNDPGVMKSDRATVRYRPATGQLYKSGPRASDVQQGAAGDCYFLSTLASAAQQDPRLIRDAITQKEDGSFIVRFYRPGPGGKPVADYVAVDRDLPRDKWGGSRYAHSAQGNELWPAVLEKAYAKWHGGYQQIGMGGDPCEVMQALTGTAGNYTRAGEISADRMFDAMKAKLQSHGLVVAATEGGKKYRGSGLVTQHGYTVLSVSEHEGRKMVTVRNPWGDTEPGQYRKGDGVFQLPLERFLTLLPDVFMSA